MEDLILVRVMDKKYAEAFKERGELKVSTVGYYREYKPRKENVKNTYDTHESDIIYDSSYQDIVMTEDLREKPVKGAQVTVKRRNKSDGSGASIIEVSVAEPISTQDGAGLTSINDSLHSYFISCWGIVENSNKAKSEYLSSMVNKEDRKGKKLIECNLENLVEAFKGSDLELIEHGKIKYDQQNRSNAKDDSELEPLFHKRKQFEEQKEYRFILGKTSEKEMDSKIITLKDLNVTSFNED